MTKVLVISDTHSNYSLMKEIVDKYKEKGYIVIHAGDYDNMNLIPIDSGKEPIKERFDRD
jgi:predicted phosphodiesterase